MTREEQWILDEKYKGEKTEGFFTDCARLKNGEPLAYIIGSIPFLNTTINLDSHPLIPRPETEFWVSKAISTIKNKYEVSSRTLHVLDLCAGSGCIGVAVAKAIPQAQVTFAEIDEAHFPTIAQNVKSNHIIDDMETSNYTHVQSDLFENVRGTFDFILTNPPYIDKDANTVDESVALHEPHLALFGGDDGFEFISRIITDAEAHLNPNGQLWIEHEPAHVLRIQEYATQYGFSIVTHKDQYGRERYSVLMVQ